MTEPIVDSHAHLTDAPSAEELEALLRDSARRGVCAVLTASARPADFEPARRLAARYRAASPESPAVFAALGVHPWHAEPPSDGLLASLRLELAHLERPVLGEIGLDYGPRGLAAAPKEVQRALFVSQLRLAGELRVPAVIHSHRSGGETFALLGAHRQIPAFLIHGCVEPIPPGLAESDRFFFSFSEAQTSAGRRRGREAVRRLVPLAADRILAESDYPAGGRRPAGVVGTVAALESLGARPKTAAALFLAKFAVLPNG